jgi:glycosyl transferase family 2
MSSGRLKRIDQRPIPNTAGEIRAFIVVRNEALRLPSTLRHHRAIGVHRFFVLDNGSTDGTLDFLANEPDVHVYSTEESYAASQWGVVWTNTLLDAFGGDRWTLTVDADEHFIYPHYEDLNLAQFSRYLDHTGVQGVVSLLLDMYADRPVKETVHDPQASLIDTCRFFDPTGYRVTPNDLCPFFTIEGGLRERIFKEAQVDFHAPTVSKIPLVRWKVGMRFAYSTHSLTTNVMVSKMFGGLLHFKFLSDFHQRVETEVARNEHFEGAREYRVYLDLLRRDGAVNFFTPASARFQDSAQLVALDLMRTEPAFEQSVQMTQAARAQKRAAGGT